MNKANELKTTTGLVKAVLEEEPQTRNSDSFLYFKILKKIGDEKGIDIEKMSVTSFLLHIKDSPFPAFETVRRTRQKIQAEFPELSANRKVEEYRSENAVAFLEYARSSL